MLEGLPKAVAGQVLWYLTLHSAVARRIAAPLGLRVRPEGLRSRMARVLLANGRTMRMIGVDRNYLTFELHWRGWQYFSPFSVLLLRELLRGCKTFCDLGANVGYYSLFAGSECPNLRAFAFEPNPKLFALLTANASINGIPVSCVNAAVSSESGIGVLHLPRSDHSGSLEPGFNTTVLTRLSVRRVALDDFLGEQTIVGPLVLKVIIEGHEPSFVQGAQRTLATLRPDMIMAVSRPMDPVAESILRDRGYAFYKVTDRGLVAEEHLQPCIEGRSFFLEHLVTTRTAAEVRDLSVQLMPRFARIDWRKTNCHRPDLEGKQSVW